MTQVVECARLNKADAYLRNTGCRPLGKTAVKKPTECSEKYMTARRGGGRRFTTRRCSVLAVHVSTCSRAKDTVLRTGGEKD
jgi:hypothetical protein